MRVTRERFSDIHADPSPDHPGGGMVIEGVTYVTHRMNTLIHIIPVEELVAWPLDQSVPEKLV